MPFKLLRGFWRRILGIMCRSCSSEFFYFWISDFLTSLGIGFLLWLPTLTIMYLSMGACGIRHWSKRSSLFLTGNSYPNFFTTAWLDVRWGPLQASPSYPSDEFMSSPSYLQWCNYLDFGMLSGLILLWSYVIAWDDIFGSAMVFSGATLVNVVALSMDTFADSTWSHEPVNYTAKFSMSWHEWLF